MSFNRNKSLSKAQKLLQKGKIQDAITEFLEIVENDPTDVRTLLRVGDLYAKVGNVESACDTYHKVAEHYAKDGFFLKAVAVFKQILKLDPGLIRVYLRLAELYQQLGLNSEAMKQYQIVVKHYENQGLKKESLDVLRKMAELDPENTASRVKLAELYVREGHGEAASEQFRSVAADLKKKNNFQDLARVYEKMEALSVADDATQLELGELFLKLAEPKKALAKLQDLFKLNPKQPQVLELLARTFMDLQQPEKAKSVYAELVQVFEEKRLPAEKDRIVSKLRAMGVTATDVRAVPVAPPEVSAPAAPTTPPTPPSGTDAPPSAVSPKIMQEVEIFLKYGLLDKACQILTQAVLAEPDNEIYRRKLTEAYQEKNDPDGLIAVLGRALGAAQTAGNVDAATAIRAEMGSLAPSGSAGAPAVAAATPSQVPEPVLESIEGEEISVEIVDDEAAETGPVLEIVEDEPAKTAVAAAPEELVELEFGKEFERSLSGEEELRLDIPEVEPEVPAKAAVRPEPFLEIPSDIEISLDLDSETGPEAEPAAPEPPAPVNLADIEPEAPVAETPVEVVGPEIVPEPEIPVEAVERTTFEPKEPEPAVPSEWPEEMEEAEFFVSQGLLEEALEVYESILGRDPGFAPARERILEIKQAKPAAVPASPEASAKPPAARPLRAAVEEIEKTEFVPKGTKRVLREEQAKPRSEERTVFEPKAPAPKTEEAGDLFDLSTELQDEIHELEENFQKKPKRADGDEDYLSPEEVISEFKKGVSRTVAKDDHPTHYNLGVAYKEMGLLDEAIHEFEIAGANPQMACDCASMIGLCLIGKKDFAAAVDVYRKTLARTSPQSEEALGLSYELAEAYIGNGNLGEAYKFFARIRDADPNFRDVRRRAKELEADLGSSAPPASAPEKRDAKEEEDDSVVKIGSKKNKISYI